MFCGGFAQAVHRCIPSDVDTFMFSVDLYYANPQFYVVLKEADDGDVGGECTCVISLMQHQYRKRKMNPNLRSLVIGLDVHLVSIYTVLLVSSCFSAVLCRHFITKIVIIFSFIISSLIGMSY